MTAVPVHSIAEAYLYLMVAPCPYCTRGPLKQAGDVTRTNEAAGGWRLAARCAACHRDAPLNFSIDPPPNRSEAASDRVNPTSERSNAIDLLGWLTLFRSIVAAADKEKDKEQGRHLAWEAAQCLDEALKFYESDNELPAEGAFFTEAGRRRFRDHPEQFVRTKLLHDRSFLPDEAVKTTARGATRRRWWQFWRRPE